MNAHHRLIRGLGMLVLASGCSSSTSSDTGGGGGAPPDSSLAGAAGQGDEPGSSNAGVAGVADEPNSSAGAAGAGDPPRSLTCMGVLRCAADCPDQDSDACAEACVERTAASSEAVTLGFLQCVVDSQCSDATCLQEKCESELSACVSDDTSTVDGTPSTEPAPMGAVPTELVGLWSSVGTSGGVTFEFEADGTTTQAFLSESNYGCALKTELTSSGITRVTGDSLVYHRIEGTLGNRTCSTVTSKAVEPADIAYRYTLGTYEDGAAKLSLYRVNEDGSLATSFELRQ
ncbi:MAG: hypothetical protein ABIQ16_01680 [Polyangiaceae bacterium]